MLYMQLKNSNKHCFLKNAIYSYLAFLDFNEMHYIHIWVRFESQSSPLPVSRLGRR